MATFFSESEVPALQALIAAKNMKPNHQFRQGMVALDNDTRTEWMHELWTGQRISFVVIKLWKSNGVVHRTVREALPEFQFPFICKSKHKYLDKHFTQIIPFTFKGITELNTQMTSFEVVQHDNRDAKVSRRELMHKRKYQISN